MMMPQCSLPEAKYSSARLSKSGSVVCKERTVETHSRGKLRLARADIPSFLSCGGDEASRPNQIGNQDISVFIQVEFYEESLHSTLHERVNPIVWYTVLFDVGIDL
jgi:hypothetical protein